jgi:hypothetical protein
MDRALVVLGLFVTVAGRDSHAQRAAGPRAVPSSQLQLARRVEQVTARNLQRTNEAPYGAADARISVDSIVPARDVPPSPARTIFARGLTSDILIVRDRSGSVTRISVRRRPPRTPADTMMERVISSRIAPRFPAAPDWSLIRNVYELAPMFEEAPAAGTVRRSTLTYADSVGPLGMTLSMRRASRALRDTLVGGARHVIVRDSTMVSIDMRTEEEDHARTEQPIRRERLSGTIVGTRLVNVAASRSVAMSDTMSLRGTISLAASGAVLHSAPYIVTRTTRNALAPSPEIGALLRSPQEPPVFDMVRTVPASERPLSPSDTVGRAAVWRVLAGSLTATERTRLFWRLYTQGVPVELFEAEFRRVALAAGDTAWVVRRIMDVLRYRTPGATPAEYAMLRRYLFDRDYAFQRGVEPKQVFESLSEMLLHAPPAITQDTLQWGCSPVVCRALAAEYRTAPDTLLRLLGLVARMTMEPAVWSDTVLAHVERQGALAGAAKLARGVGFERMFAVGDPIPPPDAPWQAWSNWMGGPFQRFRNEQRVAIRFTEARRGTNYLSALRSSWSAATVDTARMVFGTILLGFGERLRSDEELLEAALAPSMLTRNEAQQEIELLFRERSALVDSITATELGSRVVRILLGQDKYWRSVDSLDRKPRNAELRPLGPSTLPVYLRADSLPASVPLVARGTILAPMPAGWALAAGDSGRVVHIEAVRRAGPFVRVNVTFTTMFRRGVGMSGGGIEWRLLTLVKRGSEWIVVAAYWSTT